MRGSVSRHAFEPTGDFEQVGDSCVALLHLAQVGRLLERVCKTDIQRVRHQFGDLVHIGERHVERPARVADHSLSPHGAKGDDLADILAAVSFRDVVDDVGASTHAEVDIDVRERNSLRVQEAFKKQIVLERVNICYMQRVGNEAACGGPTARSHRNTLVASETDKVPDNKKISSKLHLLDEFDLAIQALFINLERNLQAFCGEESFQPFAATQEPFPCNPRKKTIERFTCRNFKVWKNVLLLFQVQVAARRNFRRARQSLWDFAEYLPHFLEGFEIKLVRGELHAGGIVDRLSGLNTNEHVLGARV